MSVEENRADSVNCDLGDSKLSELLLRSKTDQAVRLKLYRMLLEQAKLAAQKSYSPYSKFPVGSALLTSEGRLFSGCNVENASYGGTICAERTAIVKAVSEGFTNIELIAVACIKIKDAWPCGLCRQFISEFGAQIEVVSENQAGEIEVVPIVELLPRLFGPGSLGH